jgi:DNA-binding protein HU-beta
VNKSELVDAIAAATNEGQTKVADLLQAVLDNISAALQRGDKVTLPGFGTFEVRRRQARSGRNPQTGEPIEIAATSAPVFKAGATLKGSVTRKKETKATPKAKAWAKVKAPAKARPKAAAKIKAWPKGAAAKPPAKGLPKAAAKAPIKSGARKAPKAKPVRPPTKTSSGTNSGGPRRH